MREKLGELLAREIKSQKCRDVLIFTHRQADPDALCAASAIEILIRKIASESPVNVEKIVPQGSSQLGKRVCRELDLSFKETLGEIGSAGMIVAVDVGEPALLEPYLESITSSNAFKIVIDHHGSKSESEQHSSSKWAGFDRTFINELSTSTCEIIALEFPENHLDERTSQILITGIVFDSQHFGLANESTLEAALLLVKRGAKVERAREILRQRPDRSEVIAKIKAAQRSESKEIAGKYQILKSEVSSFQASVARMFVDIGADVGIAYGEHEGEARLSVRCTPVFARETGIDFGSILRQLAETRRLVGGGHPTAASISGRSDPKELADLVENAIRNMI